MTFYVLCHSRAFLAAQVESIRRHHPDAKIVVLRPSDTMERFTDFPSVECGVGGTLGMLQSVIRSLSPSGPAVFLEWDMVLTRPLEMRNACNREPESLDSIIYPSFLSWVNGSIPDDYIVTQIDRPFTTDFVTVQQRWIEPGDPAWPPCASGCHFRVLDNGILHFQRGAGYRSGEGVSDRRRECWNAIMDSLSLPHIDAELEAMEFPSVATQAANFATAAARHIAGGARQTSDAELASRFAICETCPSLVGGRCSECGCGISGIRGIVSKLSWASESCPVGKWGPESVDGSGDR